MLKSTLSTNKAHWSWFRGLTILLILASIGGALVFQLLNARAAPVLPGEQIWKQGVSSWLFGANDASWSWSQKNTSTNTAIVAAVKTAGITVIRTPLHTADAQARVQVVEQAGAQCLGILQPADAVQVVRTLGSRCNLYEWMNEPDNGGPSAAQYAASWNQYIPQLRAINPQALFIGPVVASPNTGYIAQFLSAVNASGNLPDIVSYHMYPCTDQSMSACPAHIAGFGRAATSVDTAVNGAIGKHLPLAVTEWNYSWKPGQTPQNDPYMATFTQQSLTAMAQAGIIMANQFDIASKAGNGTLDMVNPQNGQGTPQLQAMHDLIQHYQAGTDYPVTSTIPSTGTTPLPGTTPTETGITGIANTGTLLSAQQITCPSPVQSVGTSIAITPTQTATTVKPYASSTPTIAPSPQANECTFLTKITGSANVQEMLLTWWNEGVTLPEEIQIAISGDSSDGTNGTWTSWPSTQRTGGFQLLSVPGQTHWIKVHLEVSVSSTSPVIGIIEFYALQQQATPTPVVTITPTSAATITPTPTLTVTATPSLATTTTSTPIDTPPINVTSHE